MNLQNKEILIIYLFFLIFFLIIQEYNLFIIIYLTIVKMFLKYFQ